MKRITKGFIFLIIGLLSLGIYLYHETLIPNFGFEQIIAAISLVFMSISHRFFFKKKKERKTD
jgi:hypothetical protein